MVPSGVDDAADACGEEPAHRRDDDGHEHVPAHHGGGGGDRHLEGRERAATQGEKLRAGKPGRTPRPWGSTRGRAGALRYQQMPSKSIDFIDYHYIHLR